MLLKILRVLVYFDSPLNAILDKELSIKVFPPELGNKVKILQTEKVAAYTYQISRSECLHFTFKDKKKKNNLILSLIKLVLKSKTLRNCKKKLKGNSRSYLLVYLLRCAQDQDPKVTDDQRAEAVK